MTERYPQRHPSHVLAEESEGFLRSLLPSDWLVQKPQQDYGQDLRIELANDCRLEGCELVIQMKASAEPSGNGAEEIISGVKTSTYNYLKGILPVVMFVKYIRSEREAYWVLLRDIRGPESPEQATISVRIPRVIGFLTSNGTSFMPS